MRIETFSEQEVQVVSMIAVTAAELFVTHRMRDLIYPRTGWTEKALEEAGRSVGADICALMEPNNLYPGGVHQRDVESLRVSYGEWDQKYTHNLLHWSPRPEINPLGHVTARLGKKATHAALSAFNTGT